MNLWNDERALPDLIRCLLTVMLLGAASLPLPARAIESAPVVSKRTTATLITEVDSVLPGGRARIALRLRLAEGWHTYWRYPGEAGVPVELTPVLSRGAVSGPVEWPTPDRISEGSVMTYGYTGEVVLPVSVTLAPGAGALSGELRASWLVCKDICVPEEAVFPIDLPAGSGAPSAQAKLFLAHDQAVPRASPWIASIAPDGALSVRGPELRPATVAEAWFIPDTPDQIVDNAPQKLAVGEGGLTLGLVLTKTHKFGSGLSGVLSVRDRGGSRGDVVLTALPGMAPGVVPPGVVSPVVVPPVVVPPGAVPGVGPGVAPPAGLVPPGAAAAMPLGWAMAFAFLGGLILNLMPCVFPILAMKVVGFAAGAAHGTARAHAVSYTGGVVATFIAMAVGLLSVRSAGVAAGWGFQFASPVFVTAMAWLLFAAGLNLSGVFQIGGRLTGVGGALATTGGHRGSFFTGALAVLVATPCTAPFMGAAIAAGLAAEPPVTVLIFLVMGLGLAAPYALLASIPALGRCLPRPGPWMDLFRQFLAFPMYGSAVWLLWVVSVEAGAPGVLAAGIGFVLVGFAAWIIGITRDSNPARRRMGWLSAGLAVSLAVVALVGLARTPDLAVADRNAETFTPARLAALRAEGRPVFVNLTAAWCVTCLLNERVAIDNDTVRQAFAANRVAYLKGDWTRQDPVITAFLRQQGRDGVPLYLYYQPHAAAPDVLPQILTESTVLAALNRRS